MTHMSDPHPIVLSHELHAALSDLARLAGQLGIETEWNGESLAALETIHTGLHELQRRVKSQLSQAHRGERPASSRCADLPTDEDPCALTALALGLDKRVLVVEDDPDCRLMIAALLMSRGMQVSLAEDGAQALDCAAQGPPYDLILMDLDLPVLDGLTTSRKLRESGYSGRICAMSGGLERHEATELEGAGFDEALSKPLDFRRLLSLLTIAPEH